MPPLFRRKRPAPLSDADALRIELARLAIVLAHRSIVEYTRMRVGRTWPQLFSEPAFQEALDCACRTATPLCLVWVARTARRAGLSSVMGCADARAVAAATSGAWCESVSRAAVDALGRLPTSRMDEDRIDHDEALLALTALPGTPPASLPDVVTPREAVRFALLLPLDRSFTEDDRETIRNTLRLALAETHEDLVRRLDIVALSSADHAT
ncbi:hypothetical protein [Stappia stellulata]|uniref:hypothetical protein n=1 Tax=Stappia stellulata TaxID=71235 RepID=UPI000408EA5E|nr:hypothetical protein [Stappia stellulata]